MPGPDVIILGAGASGLFCALTAGQRGRSVLVLEKANKPGKKILMSGGGRCNFTNLQVEADNFISRNPHFCKSALKQYTQWDFIDLVARHGIPYEERDHGQLFCLNSARDIMQMLLDECDRTGQVDIRTRINVNDVATVPGGYRIETDAGSFTGRSLVVATGALSIPTLGGSGLGYALARQFGLPIVKQRAGLVPFMFTDSTLDLCSSLSGLPLLVSIRCRDRQFTGNMLFTHRGLSGPAVLQVSSYWHPGDAIHVDLLPGLDAADWLKALKRDWPKRLVHTAMQQHLPRPLCQALVMRGWPTLSGQPLAAWPDRTLMALGQSLNDWVLRPSGTEGYRTAEVTLGGVDTDAISSRTMEVSTQPGLYFIGEVLDVTGHLGGFNFQWAWSSGFVAGKHAGAIVEK